MMEDVFLREAAIEDEERLLQWKNDPLTRKNSINTNKITKEEHSEWFRSKLSSTGTKLYILSVSGIAAGTARLDFLNDCAEISYGLAGEYRGRGLGYKILELLEDKMMLFPDIKYLSALVREENPASVKCFEGLGYQKVNQEKGIIIFHKWLPGRQTVKGS